MEVNTISEAKTFADELKKALEGTDKNVTVNINVNVAEPARKPENRLTRMANSTHARMHPRVHVDKETGRVTTETVTGNTPCKLTGLSDTYQTQSGWKDVTHKCGKCANKHIYRPDVNRRNAMRRRQARQFAKKREEMLRNGYADCKITQCGNTPSKKGPKSYHKKFVDDNGNIITVNYTCCENPSAEDLEKLHRKMNAMLREFPIFW